MKLNGKKFDDSIETLSKKEMTGHKNGDRRFTDKLKQTIIKTGPLQSILEVQSEFETAHTLKLQFPFGITPCYEMIPSHLVKSWDHSENTLRIKLQAPMKLQITILKRLQPVFYLMADIDKGITLPPPESRINTTTYYGNTVRDACLIPDVSFPFVAFVVVTVTTFFFVQYHVTRFFIDEEIKN